MLTPSAVANAKPQANPYKLADERGMYLLVKPDGAKWWRFDYRRPDTGKRNTLSLGTFPDVSLRKAREKREEELAFNENDELGRDLVAPPGMDNLTSASVLFNGWAS